MTAYKVLLVVLSISIGSFIKDALAVLTPVVRTTKGPVQGEILHTVWNSVPYSSFKGIPFAKPPVGNLRFMPPVENEPWEEVLAATEEANICMQLSGSPEGISGSEDCLYLNVYTPLTEFNKTEDIKLKPVMVWIYGGGYAFGAASSDLHGPDFIIEEDVILVAFNYRLGALGFISLQIEKASGNAGLKDQRMALKWVRDNIAAFGGDPQNVTLFGESAGSTCVDLHVLSPKSRGLFHKSISQSGTVLCPWAFHTPAVAVETAFKLGELLGFSTTSREELLEFLLKAPAPAIVASILHISMAIPAFRPTVEDPSLPEAAEQFLVECPAKILREGTFADQPHMLGYNADEMMGLYHAMPEVVDFILNFIKLLSEAAFSTGSQSHCSKVSQPLLYDIFENITEGSLMHTFEILTDISFISGIDLSQRLFSKCNSYPIYYYRFSHQTMHYFPDVQLNGSAHADDLKYIFHRASSPEPIDPNDPLSIAQKKMVRLWTNFAKYGNPTPNETKDPLLNVVWPDSRPNGDMLDINEELKAESHLPSMFAEFLEIAEGYGMSLYTGC